MFKKTIKLSSARAFIAAVSVATSFYVANNLSSIEYSVFSILLTALNLASTAAMLGLQTEIINNIAGHSNSKIFPYILNGHKRAFASSIIAASFILIYLHAMHLDIKIPYSIVWMLSLIFISFQVMASSIEAGMIGIGKPIAGSLTNGFARSVIRFLGVLLIINLLDGRYLNAQNIIWIYIAGSAVALIAGLAYIRHNDRSAINSVKAKKEKAFKSSLYSAVCELSMAILINSPTLLIASSVRHVEIGAMALITQYLAMCFMLTNASTSVGISELLRAYGKASKSEVSMIYRIIQRNSLIVMGVVICVTELTLILVDGHMNVSETIKMAFQHTRFVYLIVVASAASGPAYNILINHKEWKFLLTACSGALLIFTSCGGMVYDWFGFKYFLIFFSICYAALRFTLFIKVIKLTKQFNP